MGNFSTIFILFFLIFATKATDGEISDELDDLMQNKLYNPLRESIIQERKDFQKYKENDVETTETPEHKDPFWITLIIAGIVSLFLVPLSIIAVVIFCGKRLRMKLQTIQQGKEESEKTKSSTYSPLPISSARSQSNQHDRSTVDSGGSRPSVVDVIELGNFDPQEAANRKPLDQRIDEITYDPKFELDMVNLQLGTILGKGHFGKVCIGWLHRAKRLAFEDSFSQESKIPVAVKMPLDPYDEDQVDMLYAEVKVMTNIPLNPNVLTLIGAVTRGGRGMYMVLEKCEFNLLDLLHKHGEPFYDELVTTEPPPTDAESYVANDPDHFYAAEKGNPIEMPTNRPNAISTTKLLSFGYQVAKGMEFLSNIPCLHRDLAARNVMITGDHLARVSDFGLARKNDKDYYRVKKSVEVPRPIRWMSREAINDAYFSRASDVWSYGIVFLSDDEVAMNIQRGQRNTRPMRCHKELWMFILECWRHKPEERPDFEKCAEVLEDHLKRANPTFLSSLKSTLVREMTKIQALAQYR
ncbi:unnamed protein product, partial [Mesorhabditis belari]|uniref:Protein kinase domain-containing protein n=1 Tax=Mesorhabditis belari TaxID=2138241 RepID=A0AAF3EIH2_9BILA